MNSWSTVDCCTSAGSSYRTGAASNALTLRRYRPEATGLTVEPRNAAVDAPWWLHERMRNDPPGQPKIAFGRFVQAKRREAGLTQRELAQLLHVTESAVSKWE